MRWAVIAPISPRDMKASMKRFVESAHRGLGTTARILPISSATGPIRSNRQSWSISAGLHDWSNASDGMPIKRSQIYSTTAACNFASRISARFAVLGLGGCAGSQQAGGTDGLAGSASPIGRSLNRSSAQPFGLPDHPGAPAFGCRATATLRRGECPKLNSSQIEAIRRAANCEVCHLIWGPPGTGKTRIIPEIIRSAGGRVLLGAFTNTAVDKMLMALLEHDPTTHFLRVGRASDSPELVGKISGDPADFFTHDLARKYGSVGPVRDALQQAAIVGATAHRASTIPYLRSAAFEMAIVDEAAQLTEPLTLGLILRARRFVLIGDDRQLPPVVRARELGQSMFERLKRETQNVTLIETQYRMHPGIMEVSNRLFYDGRLRSGIGADERTPPDGAPVVFIPVESDRDGRSNPDEARAVVELVRSFTQDRGIDPESIGIVSPFRATVVLLRQMLPGSGVAIDTVERFQGGERDIMILSFVRSRGTGFVFDDRRLNVAITRARRKLILVAHPELFQRSRYAWICTFTETLKTAGMI